MTNNKGYDIEVSKGDKIIEYIEVKTKSAESSSVIITRKEWEYAKEKGDRYTIYVVLCISDEKDPLTIQKYSDPFKLFNEGKISITPDSYRIN